MAENRKSWYENNSFFTEYLNNDPIVISTEGRNLIFNKYNILRFLACARNDTMVQRVETRDLKDYDRNECHSKTLKAYRVSFRTAEGV
jgi:hypothetical protein